jgi:putative pyoverdin transport system ATP-binding/permease protein
LSFVHLVPLRAWLVAVAAVASGLVSGACAAGLIALINTALHHAELSRSVLVAGFAGLVVAKIGSHALSRLLLVRFAQRALTHLCRELCRKVLAAPLSHLESVGIPRILATLTDDVSWLGWGAQNVPALARNGAVLLGSAIYLGWLSPFVLLVMLLVVGVGALGYHVLSARAYRYLQQARDARDVLFQHFRALTEGMKELKLHAGRREAFLSERIEPATEASRRAAVAGVTHHLVAETWSQILFYGLLGGLLIAAIGDRELRAEQFTGYILVTLYMMTPLWGMLEGWPIFARTRIALQKVRDLGIVLTFERQAIARTDRLGWRPGWHQLDLVGVTFAYPPDLEGHAFVLGPLDVTFRRGELVFVVGGNGSGKSTLVKVLTGLYDPQAGSIRADGRTVTDDDRESYRQHFSAIFSDFYLFDALLGLDGVDLDARAHAYLSELDLDRKMQITNGMFSTTALSQGQRKRLALLTAFLEDRPIYVFDEWAADQDANYREIFYRRLLPGLRARGKTVFVISHDDRYYDLGDRIVKLEYGKIVEDRQAAGVSTSP